MPIEVRLLDGAPVPLQSCPKCGAAPFDTFLRGLVQRSPVSIFARPPWRRRPYCAVICRGCKEIVDWEVPRAALKAQVL